MDRNSRLKLIFGVIMIPIALDMVSEFLMHPFWISSWFDDLIPLALFGFVYKMLSGRKSTSSRTRTKVKPKANKLEKDAAKRLKTRYKSSSFIFLDQGLTLKKMQESSDMFEATGVYLNDKYVATLADFREYDLATYEKILNLVLGKAFITKKTYEPELVNPFVDNNPQETKTVTNQANQFIEKINEYNVEIENEDVSHQLYQTSSLLTMLSTLEDKGLTQDDKNVRKLYTYYMPIMLDILKDFCKMKDNRYEDIRTQEIKLTQNIELCNKAITSILSSINDSDVMNMNVNMSTLESILKNDGMIDDLNMTMEQVKEETR